MAALFHVKAFSLITGVELSEYRVETSRQLLSMIPVLSQNIVRIHHGNLLDFDVSASDIVFVSNLCLGKSTNEKLQKKLEAELGGGAVLFLSKQFHAHTSLDQIGTVDVPMSWSSLHKLYMYTRSDAM